MNLTKNQPSSLLVACGLALLALPGALAVEPVIKHTADDMFKMADTNGDGKLSSEETAASSKQMFNDADTNHDGMLTLAELTAAQAKMKSEMSDESMKDEMAPVDMIKMHDTNKDGQLSAAEHAAGCQMMFDKMDTNHDGSLSLAECKDGAKMMKDSAAMMNDDSMMKKSK